MPMPMHGQQPRPDAEYAEAQHVWVAGQRVWLVPGGFGWPDLEQACGQGAASGSAAAAAPMCTPRPASASSIACWAVSLTSS